MTDPTPLDLRIEELTERLRTQRRPWLLTSPHERHRPTSGGEVLVFNGTEIDLNEHELRDLYELLGQRFRPRQYAVAESDGFVIIRTRGTREHAEAQVRPEDGDYLVSRLAPVDAIPATEWERVS